MVQRQALDLIDGLATIVDADVEQLVANLLELIQILFFCLDELDAVHGRGRDGYDAGSCRFLTLTILLLVVAILLGCEVRLPIHQFLVLLLERRFGVFEPVDDLIRE